MGDHAMLRNTLLAALAAATLAGCATSYSYRGGDGGGDYYYGQPQIEYRYYDAPFGYYGSYGFGRYTPGYHFDRRGRLVYGGWYGQFGYPYGYGSQWWERPRPHGNGNGDGNGGHDGNHGGQGNPGNQDADRDDRRPPWRDIDDRFPRGERTASDREEQRPRVRRQPMPDSMPMPMQQREPRSITPAPRMRSDDGEGGSRMGRVIRNSRPSSPLED